MQLRRKPTGNVNMQGIRGLLVPTPNVKGRACHACTSQRDVRRGGEGEEGGGGDVLTTLCSYPETMFVGKLSASDILILSPEHTRKSNI